MTEAAVATTAPETLTRREFLVVGKVTLTGGKAGIQLRLLPDGRDLYYERKLFRGWRVGDVISIEGSIEPETDLYRISSKSATYVRRHDDVDERRALEAADAVYEADAAIEHKRKTDPTLQRELRRALLPFRKSYQKISIAEYGSRRAFEQMVLDALREPLSKAEGGDA